MGPELILAGGLLEGIGAIGEGRSIDQASRYNARTLESNAEQVIRESGAAVEAQNKNIQQQMGRQRAAIAQSGGGFGGSAEDVARQSMAEAELDMMNTKYEGQMRARGLLAEAKQERWHGKAAKKVSYLKATTALMRAGGTYAGVME